MKTRLDVLKIWHPRQASGAPGARQKDLCPREEQVKRGSPGGEVRGTHRDEVSAIPVSTPQIQVERFNVYACVFGAPLQPALFLIKKHAHLLRA